MKLQSKILILLSIIFGVIILTFLSSQYIRIHEKELFYTENKKNQELVIDKVLQLSRIKYEQLISDNSGWDEMVSFASKPDSAWAKDNVDFFVNSFKLTFVQVYNRHEVPIYNFGDSVCFRLWQRPDPQMIETFFADTAFVHYFQYCGDDLMEIFGATIVPAVDTDTRKTAPQGYIFIAKKWDANYIAEHSEATNCKTELIATSKLPAFKQDPNRVYYKKSILNQNKESIAALLFSTDDMLKEELAPFLYISILLTVIALLAIVVFIFYFRNLILKPLSIISETLKTRSTEHLNSFNNNSDEFQKIRNLILQFFEQDEMLKRSNQELRETNATKDRLFSIIAHDLKNPVGNIHLISNLLSESITNNEKENTKELLSLIDQQTKETMALLETLFEWVKSQTGKVSFKPEIHSLKTITEQVIEIHNPAAQLKGISIESGTTDELMVFADKNMLKTVLRNLITNAIKFTHPGGLVRISAERKTNSIEITVADNGVGMDEKTISTLFHIEKNHSTLGTAKEKGSGLGLIICKEFVEKHGGSIRIQSTPGQGSRFIFTLPDSNFKF
jgi:signal transduction histidine kinase